MSVDIVIVNWNSGDYLKKCIDSIFTEGNTPFINKVIVVDNNSKDESLSIITKNDKLVFIKNKENFGFAKACNQGFNFSNADYILVLNPDTQLFDTTLKECCLFMNTSFDVDILGCQLLDEDGKVSVSCGRFPTAISFFYKSIGLTTVFPQIFTPPDLMYDWDHSESRYVDQVMGAFMFIRKEVFNKIGYFDERFFVYFEELDFSERLAEAGGKSYFNADIKTIHTSYGTTKNVKSYAYFLNLKSRLKYSKKHFNKPGHILVFISTLFFEPVSRVVFLLAKRRVKECIEIITAYKTLIKSFFVPGMYTNNSSSL
jgi:N-acetylglucosaminyl-diphospho-decaprenol L-rhamnosyltransferase